MRGKPSVGSRVFDCFNVILLVSLSVIFLYPMYHVLMASFSDPLAIMSHQGLLLRPDGFSLEGYRVVLGNPNILSGYSNTILYVISGTALNILFTAMGAYVLASDDFPYKRLLSIGIVFTMYFSGGMIPNFLLVKGLGLYNNRMSIILPTLIQTWNLIIMRTSFKQLSKSLSESAKIDGANDFTILFRIIIPIAKATIAVMVLIYAVFHWNSWFTSMLYLQDREKFPLQLILREILLANSSSGNTGSIDEAGMFLLDQLIKYCTIIIATLPILCLYPLLQRHFMAGIMVGSLKE